MKQNSGGLSEFRALEAAYWDDPSYSAGALLHRGARSGVECLPSIRSAKILVHDTHSATTIRLQHDQDVYVNILLSLSAPYAPNTA